MQQRSTRPVARARFHFAILTHGALPATQRCLRTLASTVPEPFNVFAVDNASRDGTPQWLTEQRGPWLHWQLNAENRGVPGGRNDLLDFALPHLDASDWLVFCDNDLEFEPGWLQSFEAAMRRWPDARVLGKVGHFLEVRERDRVLLPAATVAGPVDVVSGGFACCVRADAARAIGRFDEALGLFWHEDDDWCVRALQAGCEVVAVPEAAIVHHEHATGVANAGLREGGSRQNQAYLAAKWRAAGWVDAGGWVRRSSPCYAPPEVREELRRRSGARGPIGRTEFAAAWLLIDRLASAPDAAAAFAARREPVPRCLPALLAWQHECAAAGGEAELARRLDGVAAALQRERYGGRLRTVVRVPQQVRGDSVGHGLCAAADFDDPQWLAVADALEPMHCARDPHARDRVFWEQVSMIAALKRNSALAPAARVLLVGEVPARTAVFLREHVAAVEEHDPDRPPAPESFDVVVFARALDPDLVASVARAASDNALLLFLGDVVLDGAPTRQLPSPMQIEHDLLARAGLRPVAAVRTEVDAEVLEACAERGHDQRRPQLCAERDERLVTSFVVAARRAPKAAVPPIVGSPAIPALHAAIAPSPDVASTVASAAASIVLSPATPRVPAPRATIGVDLRTIAYADSSSRGIGHYAVHHLAGVARRAPELRLQCYLPDGAVLPPLLELPNVRSAALDSWSPRDVDLVHLPDPMNLSIGFDSPLRAFRHERTTVTFHDLTPLRHYVAQWPARNREAYLDRLRQIARCGAHLLCNSAFTADDVAAHLGLDRAAVTPVLAGLHGARGPVDAAVRARVLARLGLRGPFVLHVGALDPHKNFAASMSAFLQVRSRRPLQLVVAGAVDPGIEFFGSWCARRGVPDVVFTGFLPRQDLDALYAAAAGLLFLSKSEGFGFPLLEAMAAGCPVVASDATSHPEVVGDAGLLVPLADATAAAAEAIGRLLDDAAMAQRLRAAGRARAAAFTWDAVAERTLAVWRAMLGADAAAAPRRELQACTPGASMPVLRTQST